MFLRLAKSQSSDAKRKIDVRFFDSCCGGSGGAEMYGKVKLPVRQKELIISKIEE
jgi:hypothetical protein